jgi:putative flippase GtrA
MRIEAARFARANLVAFAATALDWCIVALLTWAGVDYLVARPLAAIAGAAFDFSLKRRWAFDRETRRHVVAEGARYLAVSASSLGWNVLASYLLVDVAGMPVLAGVITGSLIVGIAWNYPLHRFFVFGEPRVSAGR